MFYCFHHCLRIMQHYVEDTITSNKIFINFGPKHFKDYQAVFHDWPNGGTSSPSTNVYVQMTW